jgi:hypothetical protein
LQDHVFNADDRAAQLNAGSYEYVPLAVRQTTITPRNGLASLRFIKLSADGSIATATFPGGPLAGPATGIALEA